MAVESADIETCNAQSCTEKATQQVFAPQREGPITEAEAMASVAMSDQMTIGFEQITVSLTLLLLSLYLLSRKHSQPKIRKFVRYILCPFQKKGGGVEDELDDTDINADMNALSFEDQERLMTIRRSKSSPFIPMDGEISNFTSNSHFGDILHPKASPPHTDHEIFTRAYHNHISKSSYSRLVLPPTCRLLDSKKLKEAREKQQNNDEAQGSDPIMYLIEIIHQLMSFDYVDAFWVFNQRVWYAFAIRFAKALGYTIDLDDDDDEENDEDDDDLTAGSAGSRKSLVSERGSVDSVNKNLPQSPLTKYYNSNGGVSGRERFYTGEAAVRTDSSLQSLSALSDGDWDENSKTASETMSQSEMIGEEKKECSVGSLSSNIQKPSPLHEETAIDVAGSGGSSCDHSLNDEYETYKNAINPKSSSTLPSAAAALSFGFNGRTGSPLRFLSKGSSGRCKDALDKHRNMSPAPSIPKSIATTFPPPPLHSSPSLDSPKRNIERAASTELSYFDTATNRATINRLEREVALPDGEGYILGDHLMSDGRDTPLLAFVNSRSGSQQGLLLKDQLRTLLNPIQVWDLADGGPEKVLKSFSVLSRLRLLVCGGDGTVSWIISSLDKLKLEKWPPIAILPLGTGNDLARIHGWGGGYNNESLLLILNQVQDAYISLLDRWSMSIEKKEKKEKKKKHRKKKPETKPFTNYMSIGMDALSALQVHNLRENSPNMFFSRAVNKVWYALFGAEDAIKASCSDLPDQVVIEADGIEIPIPHDSQGIIFLNIDSYLGGVPLWSRGTKAYNLRPRRIRERRYSEGDYFAESEAGKDKRRAGSFDGSEIIIHDDIEKEDKESNDEKLAKLLACDAPSSCQDGHLDVISIRGNFHLGQIRVGLSNAQLLCQCSKAKITLKKSTAVQIDGEPWKQDKGVLYLDKEKDPAIMLHRAETSGGVESEVSELLEWAEENDLIQRDVQAKLMKEFSRRVEKKTRARRVRSQGTLFSKMYTST